MLAHDDRESLPLQPTAPTQVPLVFQARVLRVTYENHETGYRALRGNPYQLAHETHCVGFVKDDRIAESLGVARDAPHRVDAGVVHPHFTINEEGHDFAMRWELAARAEQLGVPSDLVEQSIDRGVLANHLVLEESADGIRVFRTQPFRAEVDIATALNKLRATRSDHDPPVARGRSSQR